MDNLSIDPCPMLLGRMDKNGDNFTCKSCKKEIIDFRNKSQKEILDAKTCGSTCGIFNPEQLPGQQRMSFFRQTLFYSLTALSFLGFNVSPLNAAPQRQSSDINKEIRPSVSAKIKMDKEKDKKKKRKRKKPLTGRFL